MLDADTTERGKASTRIADGEELSFSDDENAQQKPRTAPETPTNTVAATATPAMWQLADIE